jgi:hypothetical protein
MFVSQIIDEVLEILGTTDRPKALRKLTQAVQALMQSGHHYHANAEVDICTGWDGMTVTLPRGIEVPLAVNVDGSPTYFRGRLFQYHVNKGGMYNPVGWAWDDRGMVATQMDIRQPSQLIAVAENEGDAGKFIRVIGTDSNNRDLRAQLDNGTGVDGALIRVRALSEFPYGTIQPDGLTINTRSAAAAPLYVFVTESINHQFQSGQSVVIDFSLGALPVGLVKGQIYYIGVIDDYSFSLHQNELDGIGGVNPILLTSIVGDPLITFIDSRSVSLYSGVSIDSIPVVGVDSPNSVTFSQLSPAPLPAPLVEDVVYFVKEIKATNVTGNKSSFEIYPTSLDAVNGSNIISLTGVLTTSPSSTLFLRKQMTAQTKLVFSSTSGYSSGDIVQANTSGGTLPQPLIVGQNYYAHVLPGDPSPITLHLNYADSITGENSINLITAGSGSNSIVKLVEATASPGTQNNITASNFSLPAPKGDGAIVTALVSGPVTGATFVSNGTRYASNATATVSDLGGYNYTSAPTITLVGGTFTSAAQLTAVMLPTVTETGGTMLYVSDVNILNAGSGYSSANLPKVVFSGGLGSGGFHARANLRINSSGVVTGISLIPYGTGASVSVTVNTITFIPNALIINQSGSGYVYPPRLTISAPPTSSNSSLSAATIEAVPDQTFITTLSSQQAPLLVGQQLRIVPTQQPTYWMDGVVVSFSGNTLVFDKFSSNGSGTYSSWSITSSTIGIQATGVLTISPSFVSEYIVENGGSGYDAPPAISISDSGGGSGAVGNAVIDRYGIGVINVLTGGTGYSSVSTATITDSNGGTGYGATATVLVSAGVIQSVTVTNRGVGYSNPLITISPSGGSNATFSFEFTSVIASIDPVAQGTGYALAPLVTVNPSTGVFVQFSSTGTMPAPLVQGTSYRAEYPRTGNSFTVKNADFSDINITSTGSGSFYVVLSHTFTIGFTDFWSGDFTSLTTNAVRVQSDLELPSTSPVINQTTTYYLKKVTNTLAKLYTDSGTQSLVSVTGLGLGQSYFALPYTATARCFNNQFNIENIQYLSSGTIVGFTSSGTLPAPLNGFGIPEWVLNVSGNRFSLKTTFGVDVVFTDLGTGSDLSLVVRRIAENKSSYEIESENCFLQTGEAVTVRASSGDSLPNPFLSTETYYVRRTGQNSFTLFTTRNDALDNGTPIRILSVGDTIDSTFYTDSITEPTLVKSVMHVEKPVTVGYVSLYAFDYGRSNDMALIGQYHPSETNPKYRKIRIGKPCAWVRMIYRVRSPEITSEYDYIPLESPRAIIAAVHAVDLEDKDFLEQAQKYWQVASAYLRNENESMDGHAMQVPQINNLTYGDGSDPVMF